ncbi:hypothetical protein H6A19_13585 [Clostridium saudiense]|uniref:TcaA 4th domain-containing protein n=1 Tax=Clostridium saudiense TaxID=1414720 RepID=A0ABS2FIF9_9CLOT|nr:hypothetical protein [Clostridium saudiense]MBM6820350.1 hypothetical protein [Clostridium saudiense]
MRNLKEIIKEGYENLNSDFLSFIKDIKNIKEIGVKTLWERNRLKFVIMFISIFAIFIFLLSSFGLSKEEVLSKFELALINGNPSTLAQYVKVENEKVSSKELQPLIDGYDKDKVRIKKIVNELRKVGKSGNFTVESRKGFLKEKYYIDINTINVSFITNINDVDIEFSNKRFNLIDKAEFDVIPGTYKVLYTYKTEYGDISESKIVNLMEDETVEINVDGRYITLYSNFDDAKVFINDLDTGLEAKDVKNYGPLPKDKDIKIHLEREFPWGKINSEEVLISNDQYIKLDINMVNDELNNMIDEKVNEFYFSSFEALNSKDKSLILGATEEVKDMVYNYINEKAFLLSNNYEITDLSVEIEKSDFKYEDNIYKASLVTRIDYSVYKKLLPFVKNSSESSFILNLEYENEDFIIKGIQKIDI